MDLLAAVLLIITCGGLSAAVSYWVASARREEPKPRLDGETRARRRRLARQYENLLRYDGTKRGQRNIDGEEVV